MHLVFLTDGQSFVPAIRGAIFLPRAANVEVMTMLVDQQAVLSNIDHERLTAMIETLRTSFPSMNDPYERFLRSLEQRLGTATTVSRDEVDPDVVTMNTSVRIRCLDTNRRRILKLVYEREADALGGKISVLAGLGAALLGARVGEVVTWQSRSGTRRVRIERILFQPEAAGAFDL